MQPEFKNKLPKFKERLDFTDCFISYELGHVDTVDLQRIVIEPDSLSCRLS